MTHDEKQFALDLLKALDLSTNGVTKTEEEYKNDLVGETKREVKVAVRVLILMGYKKCLPISNM